MASRTQARTLTKSAIGNKVAVTAIVGVIAIGAAMVVSNFLPATVSTPSCADFPNETDTNLVGYYRLDCRSDDDSAKGNNGVTHGNLFQSVLGAKDQAALFDGVNNYIDASYIGGSLTNFTISGWFKFGSDIGNARLIAKEDSTGSTFSNPSNNWSFRLLTLDNGVFGFTDGLLVQVRGADGNTAVVQVNNALKGMENKWVYITATFNSKAFGTSIIRICPPAPTYCSGLRLFVNGLEVKHNFPAGEPNYSATPKNYYGGFPYNFNTLYNSTARVGIGADAVGAFKFIGVADDIKLYSRTLTPTEVATAFNNYRNSYNPTLSINPDPALGPIVVGATAGSMTFSLNINGGVTALVPLTATVILQPNCKVFTNDFGFTAIPIVSTPITVPVTFMENTSTTDRNCNFIVSVKKEDGSDIYAKYSASMITQKGKQVVAGTLNISQAGDTPQAGLMPASSNGVTLAKFNATAQNEDIKIEKINITGEPVNGGGWDQISELQVGVKNGSQVDIHSTAVPTSTDAQGISFVLVDLSQNPIIVSPTSSTTIVVQARTAGVGTNYPGASGQGIKLKINSPGDIRASGVQSAAVIQNILLTNASGNAQYLFRSIPTVTQQPLNGNFTGPVTDKPLYNFSVAAGLSGNIGLNNVYFKIVPSGTVSIQNFKLYRNQTTLVATSSTSYLSDIYLPFDPVETITAGTTNNYTLKADIICGVGCSGPNDYPSFSVSMIGDTNFPSPLPSGAYSAGTQYWLNRFNWTDFWLSPVLGAADPAVRSLNQWSNGYLVPSSQGNVMPATSTPSFFSK